MRFFISRLSVTIILGVLCAPDSSLSQTNNGTRTLPRLQGSIELDGMSDETAWQEITPLPLTIHLPVYGKAPTERTEINDAVARDSSATDESWNTFWDVSVIRNHEGWFAEMRIPYALSGVSQL